MDQEHAEGRQHAVDARLLSLLVCPACHGPVAPREGLLLCEACGLGYPVRDGIPVMLISEAVRQRPGEAGPADNAARGPGERHGQ